MEENNTNHGDIRPKTIYFDKAGCVKIIESQIASKQKDNFSRVIGENKEFHYLSPILFNSYLINNFNPTHNTNKSDVFSLGNYCLLIKFFNI